MPDTFKVKRGIEFRSAYADSNALWRVASVDGKYAECVIVNEPFELPNGTVISGDYAGVRKPFFVDDVKRILEYEARLRASLDENEAWFDSLTPGQIVHYHNGFGEFVRCEVVRLTEDMRSGPSEYKAGQTVLQPIALVGNWRHDLPWIDDEGVERYPYHAEKVVNRTGAWRPHQSCVFESPAYSKGYSRNGDPTGLPALDLTPRRRAA